MSGSFLSSSAKLLCTYGHFFIQHSIWRARVLFTTFENRKKVISNLLSKLFSFLSKLCTICLNAVKIRHPFYDISIRLHKAHWVIAPSTSNLTSKIKFNSPEDGLRPSSGSLRLPRWSWTCGRN